MLSKQIKSSEWVYCICMSATSKYSWSFCYLLSILSRICLFPFSIISSSFVVSRVIASRIFVKLFVVPISRSSSFVLVVKPSPASASNYLFREYLRENRTWTPQFFYYWTNFHLRLVIIGFHLLHSSRWLWFPVKRYLIWVVLFLIFLR